MYSIRLKKRNLLPVVSLTLTDLYRDVKGGLDLFDSRHPIDAAWEWRFNFQIHWGQRLVGPQRCHEYLADEGL